MQLVSKLYIDVSYIMMSFGSLALENHKIKVALRFFELNGFLFLGIHRSPFWFTVLGPFRGEVWNPSGPAEP